MIEKVRTYMLQTGMVQKGDRVIVGISGGPDSICLLCVLKELEEALGTSLAAVHVNHMLRGKDAREDEQFVSDFCEKMHVPLNIVRVDVAAYASEHRLSVEEAGRAVRRQAFEQTMDMFHGNKIALAHHMNDNAETVLFHLARGTGIKGAAGIRPKSGSYIRPLLCLKREEIESYLEEKHIPSCLDKTNLENIYTRNKIRNEVLPYFQEHINVRTVEHIHAFTEQMRELGAFVERQVEECYARAVVHEGGNYRIKVGELERIDLALRPYVIQKVIAKAAGREKDIEAVHLRAVEELMRKQSGRQVDLPYGLKAFREYNGICIVEKNGEKKKDVTPLIMIGDRDHLTQQSIDVSEMKLMIDVSVFERRKNQITFEELPYTKWFDYDIIKSNVVLRTRQTGDRITINDSGQTQTLKKFFINNKIPESERDQILLIADENEIMWAVGHRQSKKYQITDTTKKVLEIKITNYGGEDNVRKY